MKVAQERQFYVHDRFVAYNGDQAEFSNFYVAPFKAPVLTANDRPVMEFQSVEQYFAYNKAILFGDNEIAQKIMAHTRGAKLKADGRNVGKSSGRPYSDEAWQSYVQQVLQTGMQAKFSQNPSLRDLLLSTGSRYLVEGNGSDSHYGAGIWSYQITDRNYRNGKNLQGKMLMEVRDQLVRSYQQNHEQQSEQVQESSDNAMAQDTNNRSRYGFSFEENGYQNYLNSTINSAGYAQPQISVNPNTVPFSQKPYVVALTGHRPYEAATDRWRGNGGVISSRGDQDDIAMQGANTNGSWRPTQDYFENYIKQLVQEHGHVEIHSGLAMGADMIWARAALKVRNELGADKVHVIADVPFNNQAQYGYEHGQNLAMYNQVRNMADAVVIYGDDNDRRRGLLYEKRNQGMFMNADEGVEYAADELFNNIENNVNVHSGTQNGISDIRRYGLKETRVNPRDFGFDYQTPIASTQYDNGRNQDIQNQPRQRSVQSAQVRQAQQNIQQPAQANDQNVVEGLGSVYQNDHVNDPRVEYLMQSHENDEHNAYIEYDGSWGTGQTRYAWRKSNIDETSPVSVPELMKLISPAISSSTNRSTMQQLLYGTLSSRVQVVGEGADDDNKFVNIISSTDPATGKTYDMSPSDVQTVLTVLTALHDTGIDYDIRYNGRDHSIAARLKDNSGLMVTLVDPKEPQRVGEVKTHDDTHWAPVLGRIRYNQKDVDGNVLDQDLAIGTEYHRQKNNGQLYSVTGDDPTVVSHHKPTKKDPAEYDRHSFRVNARRISDIQPRDTKALKGEQDLSQLITRARYTGLDQGTKNRLALASLVNAVGINPDMLSPRLREYVSDAKIKTVNMLGNKAESGYQAQVDLGRVDGNIANVVNVDNVEDGTGTRQVDNRYLANGDVSLNLSSAAEISNVTKDRDAMARLNPNQFDSNQADNMIVEAYQTARVNWLNRLTDKDQSNSDELLGKAQRKFRDVLMNKTVVSQDLIGNSHDQIKRKEHRREMLDIDSQELVLNQFKNALLDAGYVKDPSDENHLIGIDDSALMSARNQIKQSTTDADLRQRRLESFDGLMRMFDNEFGTAPLQNAVPVYSFRGLDFDGYKERYSHTLSMNSETDRRQKLNDFDARVSRYENGLKQIVGAESYNDGIMKLPFDEQRRVLSYYMDLNKDSITPEQKSANLMAFDQLVDDFGRDMPLKNELNVASVIAQTESRANSVDYEFKMAQAGQKGMFKANLGGVNDMAVQRVMERSVPYDEESAMTIDQLRAEDKNPDSAEGKLQAYVQSVKSGQRKFSFDDPENPDPGAFKYDGSGDLINPISKNEFKARALERIKQRLVNRGADPDNIELKIDKHGVVSFKTQLPLYNVVTGEAWTHGQDYQRDDNGNIIPSGEGTDHVFVNGDRTAQNDGKVRYQPISGTFGQIFAPDHDGLIRTEFYRYPGYDQSAGQKTMIPRGRAVYQLLDVDERGNYVKKQLMDEAKNGLGLNNRLVVMNYEQVFNRQLDQALDNLVSTKNVGNVSQFNSNTIMNKTFRGGMLADEAPEMLVDAKPDMERQAKLQSRESAIRFNDDVGQSTKFTEVIQFMHDYQRAKQDMQLMTSAQARLHPDDQKLQALVNNPEWPDKYDVEVFMHAPISNYGNTSIGEVARSENLGIVSKTMTGQGGAFGTLMYLVEGAQIDESGHVIPAGPKDENGNPVYDKNGKMVRDMSAVPVENLPMFRGALKNSADRTPVGKDQAMKGHQTTQAHVASMALGAWTQEDGMVISKTFAQNHMIKDSTGVVRPLKIGDKISDGAGNKATISMVVDPQMDPKTAEHEGVGDVVALFKQNPDLDVVMNGMSQLSRNNAGTAYDFVNNESSEPMKFTRMVEDENGNMVPGETVQTNATINTGYVTITDQTVDHKVTLYDEPGEKGRKSGGLGGVSDLSKNAPLVANYFRKEKNGLLSLRQHMLVSGIDFDGNGMFTANYNDLIKSGQADQFTYDISKEGWNDLDKAFEMRANTKFDPNATNQDRFLKLVKDPKTGEMQYKSALKKNADLVFDGLNADGELTDNSLKFLRSIEYEMNRHSNIAMNDEAMQNGFYNPGRDFLNQLPDGGVLKLPEGVSYQVRFGDGSEQNRQTQMYILPQSLRNDTRSLDGQMVRSNFNRLYAELGTKLAKYQLMHKEFFERNKLAADDPQLKAAIERQMSDSLGIQDVADRISKEANKITFGDNPKHSEYNQEVLAGRIKDSATSQVSSNPNLPMDVIEISPEIAKKLDFVLDSDKSGYAHMKGHEDWTMLHVHRDPIWREQGSLAFRVKINPELSNVRINPVMASLMDGDFDGDNLGLIAMRGDDVQQELKDKVSVDHWLLDNNGVNDFPNAHSLLNINAEIVDSAVRTNQTYTIEGPDGSREHLKLFDHKKDKFGNNVPLSQDPALQKTYLAFMKQVRSDVLPAEVRDKDGKLDEQKASVLLAGDKSLVNDSDILNMAVDNVIKNNYQQARTSNDSVFKNKIAQRARMSTEILVQKARGYNLGFDKDHGDLVLKSGTTSQLANDGVNYKDEKSMASSLTRYINEGAKGSPEALSGLFEYMHKPEVKELSAMAKQQYQDGRLDEKLHEKYVKELDDLSETILAVQRSTKEKSDITGVPGNIQKMITAVLIDGGTQGLHAANAIGQAGTQKVLSIKRDPQKAAQVAEILQGPVTTLLDGKRPTESPLFALVGAEKSGRLGNDTLTVADRMSKLRHDIHLADGKTIFEQHRSPKEFSNEEVLGIAKQLDMKIDPDNVDKFTQKFKDTLTDVVTPYVPNKGKDAILDPSAKDDDPLSPTEFVNAMDYLYNDQMGLGVDRKNFELLAKISTDPQTGAMRSVKQAVGQSGKDSSTGWATFVNKLKQQGYKPVAAGLSERDHPNVMDDTPVGKVGSPERDLYFGGITNEQVDQALDLRQRENPFATNFGKDEPRVSKAAQARDQYIQEQQAQDAKDMALQNEMLGYVHKDVNDDVRKREIESTTSQSTVGVTSATSQADASLDNLTKDSDALLNSLGAEAVEPVSVDSVLSNVDTNAVTRSQTSVVDTVDVNNDAQTSSARSMVRRNVRTTTERSQVDTKTASTVANNISNNSISTAQATIDYSRQPTANANMVQQSSSQDNVLKNPLNHDIYAGNYRQAAFSMNTGNNASLVFTTVNQSVAYQYAEKAEKAGILNSEMSQKVKGDILMHPEQSDLHNQLLFILNKAKEQNKANGFFNDNDDNKFFTNALIAQGQNQDVYQRMVKLQQSFVQHPAQDVKAKQRQQMLINATNMLTMQRQNQYGADKQQTTQVTNDNSAAR